MTLPEGKENMEKGKMEKDKNTGSRVLKLLAVVLLAAALGYAAKTGLGGSASAKQAEHAAPPAPTVAVKPAQKADLASVREYIGRVESIQTVDVRPQVTGEIMKVHFKEGSVVKAGEALFTIDSSRYKATVDLRTAETEQAAAALDKAEKYLARLKAADKRSIAESDMEAAESAVLAARASVSQAKAAHELAKIDLAHTKITAPITGRVGAAAFTKGNLVSPQSGSLASIVQISPIRVAFSLPDKDYLDQLEAFKKKGSVYETQLRLANGKAVAAKGQRDFEDNRMDIGTGSMMMRIRFDNSDGMLVPGSMVRVGTKPVESKMAILIPQTAIMADSKGDFVYALQANNTVVQKRIVIGSEVGSMCEVKEGLLEGEKIVVMGLQALRPGVPVNVVEQGTKAKSAAESAMESTADKDAASSEPKAGN